MAIKDFIIPETYTRIERLEYSKQAKFLSYVYNVYKDSTGTEILVKDIRNEIRNIISLDSQNDIPEFDKYVTSDTPDLLKICYLHLSSKPEFVNTQEC